MMVDYNLKEKTTKGVFWSFFERFSTQGVAFLVTLVMARLLTPGDYGLVGMLTIFMSLAQVFIDGGFSSALIQYKDRTEKDFSTVFYINLGISIVMYFCLVLSAPWIADFYDQPVLENIIIVYTLVLVINSLSAVNKTILVINVDFKTQSKISLFSSACSGVIGILAAMTGKGVWALIIQQVTSACLNVIASFYFVRWYPKLIFSLISFKKLFGFGSKLLVATIISNVYSNLYFLVIGKKFSAVQLGYYTQADKFVQLVSTNITGILTRVSFPVLSKIQDDDDRLLKVYEKYIQFTAFIMFPLIMGLCGTAKPLLLTLLTEKWFDSIHILQILCLASLFNGIAIVNLNLLYVKGRSDLVLKLELIKKSIAFSILFISIFFNLEVVCWGLVLYGWIGLYLNTIYTKKLLNYSFLQQLKVIFPYLAISIVVLLCALALSEFISNYYLSLIVSLIVCPLLYVYLSHKFNLYAYNEGMKIIKPISCKFIKNSQFNIFN